jgi:hypothetical protein
VVARRSRHNPSESAWFGPNAPRAAARQDVFWPPSSAPHAQSGPRNEVRRSGGQGVAGSNPVSPTKHSTLNDLVGVGFTNYGPPGQKRSPSIEHCLHIRTQIAHRNGRVLVPAQVSCIGATAHAPTTASRPGWRSHSNPGKGLSEDVGVIGMQHPAAERAIVTAATRRGPWTTARTHPTGAVDPTEGRGGDRSEDERVIRDRFGHPSCRRTRRP